MNEKADSDTETCERRSRRGSRGRKGAHPAREDGRGRTQLKRRNRGEKREGKENTCTRV